MDVSCGWELLGRKSNSSANLRSEVENHRDDDVEVVVESRCWSLDPARRAMNWSCSGIIIPRS